MKIEADFSQISSSFEPVPDDSYRAQIVEITENEKNNKPQVVFELEITEGPHKGRKLFDFLILQQNDGKPNKVSLGRVKAYAEATVGKEAAAGQAIDTEELKGGTVEVVVKSRTYDKDGGGQGTSSDIVKVIPVT